jgi:hypothetical protein
VLGIPECATISVPICENTAPAVGHVWQHNACEQALRPDNKASGRSQSFCLSVASKMVSARGNDPKHERLNVSSNMAEKKEDSSKKVA